MARKKRSTYEMHGIDMRGGAFENMSKEQLARLAAHEAKIANQRMRRLEAAGYGGTNPTSAAYRVVKSDISRWFPYKEKFSESANVYAKMRITTIKAILRDFEYYKTLKTATVSGTKAVVRKRRNAFQDKTGQLFESDEQFERFWKSGVGKFLFGLFGSEPAIDMLSASKKDMDDLIDEIKKFKDMDNGDKDNADELAKQLGFENLEDARKQADKQAAKRKEEEEKKKAKEEEKKKAKEKKPAQKKRGVGAASLRRAADIARRQKGKRK